MSIYTISDAQQKFDQLLEEARRQKEVLIQGAEDEVYLLIHIVSTGMPTNLPKLDVGLTRDEIVSYIREVRER